MIVEVEKLKASLLHKLELLVVDGGVVGNV
nr:MAG TPA: hypothetical protein [Caudoviricetes sp.]